MSSSNGFMRLERDELFMSYARLVGLRGTCLRARVGAVIVFNNRPVSSGYVGSAPGQPHCFEVGCNMDNGGCTRTVHAEANAIAWAAREGIRTNGSTIYSTHSPCRSCAQLILAAGISEVVYDGEYRDRSGLYLLNDSAVVIRPFSTKLNLNFEETLQWQW